MSRIFSYFTRANGKILSYYHRQNGKKFDDWRMAYDRKRTSLIRNNDEFFEISKNSSLKNGWVGKIVDPASLPDINAMNNNYVKLTSTINSIHDGIIKIDMNFGDKVYKIPLYQLIETKKQEYVKYSSSESPNKKDMLGTETREKDYVIYRYDNEMILGTIIKISQKAKAIYCCDFSGLKEKRIDHPECDLIVIRRDLDLFSLMSKRKLIGK